MERKTKEKLSICSFLLSSSLSSFVIFLLIGTFFFIFWVCQSKYLPLLYASCVPTHCVCVTDAVSCQAFWERSQCAARCSEVNFYGETYMYNNNKKKKKRNNKIANDKIKHAYERLKRMKITYINGMVIWLRWRWRRCRATTIQQKKSWNLNKQMSKSRDSWHNYCTMHWVNNCPPSCIICSHAFYNCIQLLRYVC